MVGPLFEPIDGRGVMIFAYLGPGLGAGALIVVVGVGALVIVTLITFLWFPIKRFLNKRK